MQELTLKTSVFRKPDLVSTDMDGDTVMMSIERGEYYGIGGIGTRVWNLLEKPLTIEEIIQDICSEYEVPEATCQADVFGFISELAKNDLITFV